MAIIGKPKKDLITYGVINLMSIAYMIYIAISNSKNIDAIITVILVFSFEILLLIISSMFFFFTKKSEYDIVFEDRLKTRKDNQPQEYKKLKKTYILISLALVLIVSISQILKIVGYVFIALATIGFIIMTIIVLKKNNNTEYKLKVNVIASTIGLIIALVSSIYGCFTLSKASTTINWSNFSSPAENVYLYKESENEKYIILIGRADNDPMEDNIVYWGSNGILYTELPSGSIQAIERYSCRYRSNGQDIKETYYKYFDINKNNIMYYYEQTGEELEGLPANKTIHFITYKPIEKLLIIICVFLASAFCILITYDLQFEFDVKKQLKAEEKGQVINKYSNNTSQAFQQQNIQPDTNIGQTPQTRVLPPLPKEIKERMEQNRNNH